MKITGIPWQLIEDYRNYKVDVMQATVISRKTKLLLNLLTPLDPRNDVVVRMSAASALRFAVDEWHFRPDDFLPYLDILPYLDFLFYP